jgi:hypothetical protein
MTMPTLVIFLCILSLLLTIGHATWNPPRIPLWIPVFLIHIVVLLLVYGK